MIARATDADFFNRVLNHPAVRPDVADMGEGVIDASKLVANQAHQLLVDEHGGCIFLRYYEGCYEVHTAILPSGRGKWAKAFAEGVLRYMFTVTDAVEIITRVPQGHIAAKALTEIVGFRHHFTTLPETKFRGELVPCHVYNLWITDWAMRAPDMEDRGAKFHQWLNRQVKTGTPHRNDPAHNRIVGVALEMMLAGRARKAAIWYNRWAVAARHAQISLVSEAPPQVKFDAGLLTFAEDGVHFERAN